jgi:hypothetical protein
MLEGLASIQAAEARSYAILYLKRSYDEASMRWPAFPREANAEPHAVWWHFADGEALCEAEKAWGLPSAEILGIMLKHDPDDPRWERCFGRAIERIEECYPAMEMNEAVCYCRMLRYLEGEREEQVAAKMRGVLDAILEKDASKWASYGAKPLMYVESPNSPLYPSFAELIEANLDWEIDAQGSDGAWAPSWTWYRDEEHWPEAREDWKSLLTAERLVTFKRFRRIGA